MSRRMPSDRTVRGVIGTGTLGFAAWVLLPTDWMDALGVPLAAILACCLAAGIVLNRRTRARDVARDMAGDEREARDVARVACPYPVNPRLGLASGPYIDWSGVIAVDAALVREAIRPIAGSPLPTGWNAPVLLTVAVALTGVALLASLRERHELRR